MCEIYALCARRPVVANAHLRLFFADSVSNPHGWGLFWRKGRECLLHKEPLRAVDSSYLASLLEEPIRSCGLVAHIRNATCGVLSYENCHPFLLEDRCGATWAIAHNGTILDEGLTKGYAARAAGDTDSERAALFLVDQVNEAIRHKGSALLWEERFEVLAKAVTDLSRNNKLNLIIDDGECTYVHTNTKESTLYVRADDDASFFCTRPLEEGDGWVSVPKMRLICYRDGHMLREGDAHGHAMDEAAYLRSLRERNLIG